MGQVYIHKLAMILVIAGALNWGLTALNFNAVEFGSNKLNMIFNSNIPFDKVIYITIAILSFRLMKRDALLPFLGKTVLPTNLIPLKENKYHQDEVKVHVKPNTKVVYWAAKKLDEKKPSVWKAYDDYSNSGVVMSDEKGIATLKLEKGSGYMVPWGDKYIPPHVHYRYEIRPGKLSRIETKFY